MKLIRIVKVKFKNADFVTNLIVFIMLLLAGLQSLSAQCPTPPGDPSIYGTSSWIGYVYSGLDTNNPPQNAFASGMVYRGYVTQPEQFNQDLGTGSISGANLCGTYADGFSIRFRMHKNWAPGYYSFTVGGDDGYRLSFDGGATWSITNWGYHSYTSTTATFFLSGETDMVIENYDQGGSSQILYNYTSCGSYSTAPTSIAGTNAICNGTSTTLTATGGTLATGAVYQWGTGTTIGSNVMAGQTSESITVSPTANTTYWVRRIDPAPCNIQTAGVNQLVTVTTGSTAPTTLTAPSAICLGASTTLTATGGTLVAGSAYEWGTGTVGSNIISGQTGNSINVTPTVTTTYWVRKTNAAPCATTAALTTTVTVNTPPGDQISYGNNSWIGYVYASINTSNPPTDAFMVPYKGYLTQPEIFNQNWGSGSVSGANICGSYDNRFAVRFKMEKNFTPGYYTFTVGGDDGYRLSLDGGTTFPVSNWTEHSYATSTSTQYYLSGQTFLVLEFYEQGGDAQVSFNYTACTDWSTAPTAITGTTTVCSNTSTTLTATGGYASATATYQWGTGTTIGSNVIGGQTAASITANLGTNSTTYWVRRIDPSPCNLTTAGVTQLVTVVAPSTQPTGISGTTSICAGNSTTLTATGGTLATGAVYQWGTGSIGNNIIAGQTAVSIVVSPTANTTYWVRRIDAGPCNTITSGPTVNIAVSQLSTAPTSINNVTALCSPVGGVTLSANGGTSASGSTTYQWGTGAVIGTNPIGGQTNSTYYVNPTAVTTYWVRRYDPAPCATYTTGTTVTVYPISTAPTTITGTNSICIGGSTTLTVSGGTNAVNATYEWGTGSVGNNIISGQTAASITVSPTTNTTYWVRRVDAAPCSASTSGVTYNVTVNPTSTAPTSINSAASICSPVGGVTLNAIGGTAATGSTYQWGTGAVVGTSAIGGQTNSSYYVNPTAVTTYWVRRYDPAPCGTYTTGVTVTVYPASTAPTTLTGTSPVCSGTNVTLTASGGTHGALASYQWGTGSEGMNIIAGQTASTLTVAPTTTTTYWVRRTDSTPCTTVTGSTFYTITVNQRSTAPTSITGPSSLCYTAGGGTLTAVGGTPGTNATYQWGIGTVGSNIQASTVNTMYINPSVTTTYWVRLIDPAPCSSTSAAATFTVSVNTTSTAPTGISGTTSICNGGSTTLTATGGTLGVGAAYQWGTGTNPGSNIITGQTGVSMTVSPTATTTYWVRRVDGTPCTTTTWGPNVTVAVGSATSTAPTSITGAGAAACAGASYTLTATGGTGSTYQWGTGATVGSNIIAGQTGASITVSPTSTTTYWVRRYDAAPCNVYTAGVTTTVNITAPPGNPTAFGNNKWIVYGYSTVDITLATAVYAGYYTQSTVGFDTTLSWANNVSPSSASNWDGCPVPVDNFTFVHKRRGFPCGNYTINMLNWDDAAELYIDGILRWSQSGWGTGGANGVVGNYALDANSTIEVRVRENGGAANAALQLINNTVAPTAPTAISGNTIVCGATSTTLTASGGTLGTNGIYEWGTGTVGTNIISDVSTASITVSPTVNTTYWVRRVDNVCSSSTTGISQLVTVSSPTVAGSLSTTTTTVCQNTMPSAITLSGQTGNVVKWQYASNAAFTSGVTDINVTSTTLSPSEMGALSSTRYYRAVVRYGSCTTEYTTPVAITVPTAVNYTNGAWSAMPNENTPVVINSNLTLATDLKVCSCQVKNGVTMTVNSNANLIVKTALVVDAAANLVFEDKASLVQIEDAATDMGAIKFKRNTTPMKNYDYCYWASPVQNNTLLQLSPLTLSDKYFKFDPTINNWSVIAGGNQVMELGRGYIVRAPQGWSTTNVSGGIYSALFNGVPNNGVVPATIQKGAGTFNLIGNPYPSAIDIDLFLTDPANTGIISGTIYLWTHNTAISSTIPGNQIYNYNADDYAKYNLTGGVQSANPAITGGHAPDGKVAAGQGFFIEANPALANGNYNATFRNSMRVIGHNDTFYRQPLGNEPRNTVQTQLEKNRFWLNLTNANGAYNEVLVGYVTGATNEFDNLFDGKTFPAGNNVSLYTISGADNYSIQGRALPFNDSDVIPLGYKTTVANTFTIALENVDGLFTGQNIYLIDHLNNSTTDLKQGNYTFTSAVGTFNDRFEIRFTTSSLGTDTSVFNENSVAIIANHKQVGVRSSRPIESVTVFDLLGRTIFSQDKINAQTFKTTTLTSSEQVMIVKVALEGGYEITRKVILD